MGGREERVGERCEEGRWFHSQWKHYSGFEACGTVSDEYV